jgi:hypothetical protein
MANLLAQKKFTDYNSSLLRQYTLNQYLSVFTEFSEAYYHVIHCTFSVTYDL